MASKIVKDLGKVPGEVINHLISRAMRNYHGSRKDILCLFKRRRLSESDLQAVMLGYDTGFNHEQIDLWSVRNRNLPRAEGQTIAQIEKIIARQQKMYLNAYSKGRSDSIGRKIPFDIAYYFPGEYVRLAKKFEDERENKTCMS